MITELEFTKDDTRETALAKAVAWYDDLQHDPAHEVVRAGPRLLAAGR